MSRTGREAAPAIFRAKLKSWGRAAALSRRKAAPTIGPRQHATSVQGSSPIPRKITLVTVCTAFSKAMSDNASPPLSNVTW